MANTKRRKPASKPKPRTRLPWTASELLYAVFGYLTTRQQPLILSGHHEAVAIAEFLDEVLKTNKIPGPGVKYPKLKVSADMELITNVPKRAETAVVNTQAGEAKERNLFQDPDAVLDVVNRLLNENLDLPEQNKFLQVLIKRMATARREFIQIKEKNAEAGRVELDIAHGINSEFLKLLNNS